MFEVNQDTRNRLFFIVLKKIRNREDAEDITHESISILLEAIKNEKIKKPDKINSFLIGTSYNLMKQYFEKNAKSESSFLEEKGNISDENGNTKDMLFKEEIKSAVKKALRKMNWREQVALKSYYLLGFSYEEISSKFGISPNHLKVILYRARNNFKKIFTKLKKV